MPEVTEANESVLKNIRSLLLLFEDLTDVVSDRITPNQFGGEDHQQPSVMLELRDCEQQNTLDRSACLVTGNLVITIRSMDDLLNDQLAEVIRTQNTDPASGLDGFSGPCGSGILLGCERSGFDTSIVFDEDGDETDLFDSVQMYRIHFQIRG